MSLLVPFYTLNSRCRIIFMKNKLIGVIMGGVSSEREISLRSGKNVLSALQQKGYNVKGIDIVSRDCAKQLQESQIDAAFNILHGEFGEDGGVQQLLEDLKIPYTGSGVSSSQNCMHKVKCKNILVRNNLPTPLYEVPANAKEISFTAPLVVKAATQGSSIGVTIVKNNSEVEAVFNRTAKNFTDVFLEKFVPGAEVTVGVIEDNGKLIALPILELRPKGAFYDFESKYTPGGTEFILPAELSDEVTKQVQGLAVSAFTALGCAGAVRVDFVIVDRKDPTILEINTIPGMTDQSDLPAEAKAFGIDFGSLVEKILLTARLGKF